MLGNIYFKVWFKWEVEIDVSGGRRRKSIVHLFMQHATCNMRIMNEGVYAKFGQLRMCELPETVVYMSNIFQTFFWSLVKYPCMVF